LSTTKSDITIVGAGLIGSALALWLAKNTDYSVTLLERNSIMSRPKEANQRVVALGALATNFLDDVGVLEALDENYCHAYKRMLVWDERSDGELFFDSSSAGESYLGHMIDSQMCAYQLQHAVSKSQLTCHFDASVSDLDLNESHARIKVNNELIKSQLIIAADGSRSWVRQQAKIFANHHSYEQRGIVATIETEKSHQDCAWQCFLSSGPVAILPLANNQSSIVWSADNALAEELLAMDDSAFAKALSTVVQARLGSVKLLSKRQAFPLGSLRAETYFKRNLVLLGDAAHSIHPLAGQGANLGFKDANTLGKLLASATSSELGSPRLLAAYQAKRQPDNNQTDSLMSALHQAYKLDLPIWSLARGFGMNFISGSDTLTNALARRATGL